MTVRNITFNGCTTGIYQNWGWVWNYKHLVFNDVSIGFDISNGGSIQTVGSVIMGDSVFNSVTTGILTSWSNVSTPVSGGSLVVDNCDFSGADTAILDTNGTVVVAGGVVVESFVQGRAYTTYFTTETIDNKTCLEPGATGVRIQSEVGAPPKPAILLDSEGRFVERMKPQYEGEPLSAFKSVKDAGCVGDGLTDDTVCLQTLFDSVTFDDIIYFDHGAYLISDTIQVPSQIRMTGEIWPLIMIDGAAPAFSDISNPKVAWRVGHVGETGRVEMSEMVFETRGSAPGCIIMEWNLAGETPGDAGSFFFLPPLSLFSAIPHKLTTQKHRQQCGTSTGASAAAPAPSSNPTAAPKTPASRTPQTPPAKAPSSCSTLPKPAPCSWRTIGVGCRTTSSTVSTTTRLTCTTGAAC